MTKVPNTALRRGAEKIILRAEIEEAQRHTNSNYAAAKYLNADYRRYRKYAKLYGLFERHLNPTGIGSDKGFGKNPTSIPLREILEGKHPNYNLAKLKSRLLSRKKLHNHCYLCGFTETRITDGKGPFMIHFKDGDHKNFSLHNLELYCYNCMFLTTGAPWVATRGNIERSFINPAAIPKTKIVVPTPTDALDKDDLHQSIDQITLTEEERQALLDSL